jgi:hypothetical protein
MHFLKCVAPCMQAAGTSESHTGRAPYRQHTQG